jgi:dTDP-4-amino-4,6-dideoxygalactose transaminase
VAKQILEERFQTQMTVPFVDLKSEHQKLRSELRNVWDTVLDNAAFIGGRYVAEFETSFARFCQTEHAIGVANGTDALLLALRALGIGANDEVITAANSFVATAEAIVHAGAKPVFVDIEPCTYTIDVDDIERHITPRTKAIIPVHIYGQPADMVPILGLARRYGLKIIEDAAQAHGARYHGQAAGSIGDVACFSFYPAKNLGACGDGGAVVTNNHEIATAVRRLRDHGGLKKYEHQLIGYNSRLDSLQAAVLHTKLPYLDGRNALRRQHAATYNRLLAQARNIAIPSVPEDIEAVYHLYVIRVEDGLRNALQAYLREHFVETGIHYPAPIHRTHAFRAFSTDQCPVAEQYAEQILSLPMYAEMETRQVEYVANLVCDYMNDFGGRN